MKILFLADVEAKLYWDYFQKEYFRDIDLIISCGDLKAEYLSFLATMTSVPVWYIKGNHDDDYEVNPPGGCRCIDGEVVEFNGLCIAGLGGCHRYKPGINQYTDRQMKKRAKKLRFAIWRRGGLDILVTHAPASGLNDWDDLCHQGFPEFNRMIDRYQPKYFVHGHVHMNYGRQFPREDDIAKTHVINAYEKFILEL